MIRIYILISQISFTSTVVLPLSFFFFSRIPQLQNTSSMSLLATVHLNIQIPQLVTLILNTSFLLLYLSIPHQIFIHHKYTSFFDSCVTVQYMSHNSRTKDHGTVSSRNKNLCYGHPPSCSPEQLSVCWIYCKLPGKFCLLSPRNQIFRWKHCAKMISESSVPNRVGIWTTLL